jgi:DNA replication protein DnaC
MRAERAELLVNAGFPIDYLDLKYECKKCSDEGFYKGQMCQCYLKELNKLSAVNSNLSSLLGTECFKNFKLDYYSDAIDPRYGISPRTVMEKTLRTCRTYAAECLRR